MIMAFEDKGINSEGIFTDSFYIDSYPMGDSEKISVGCYKTFDSLFWGGNLQ